MSVENEKKEGIALVAEKLITHEDPYHLHKGLGVIVVISFIWRLTAVGYGDMYFSSHPHLTVPQILACELLVISSFIFKIPQRRIKEGSRIWPQARFHTCIFTTRSLAAILLLYIEQQYNLPRQFLICYAIQMGSILAADIVDRSFKDKASNSIRDTKAPAWSKAIASYMQFRASTIILLGPRKYSAYMMAAIIIIVTPFFGTLRRKNLISHEFMVSFYLFLLVLGIINQFCLNLPNHLQVVTMGAGIAALLRAGPRLPVIKIVQNNKYLMWTLIALFVHYVRPDENDQFPSHIDESHMRIGTGLGVAAVLYIIAYKEYVDYAKSKKIDEKKEE